MINLPNVTLVNITSVKHEQNIKSLVQSKKHIKFGSVKFISDIKPDYLPSDIEYCKCDKLDSLSFAHFAWYDWWKYIDTELCLFVHHDGFVLNPKLWSDDFLKFDWVGAPWPNHSGYHNKGRYIPVGNGGFAIRSRKILKAPTDLNLPLLDNCGFGFPHEDMNYCNYHYDAMIEYGIKYADIDTAARFATEMYVDGHSQNSFGFHDFRYYPQFEKILDDIDLRG
jgi:hypothetical protein